MRPKRSKTTPVGDGAADVPAVAPDVSDVICKLWMHHCTEGVEILNSRLSAQASVKLGVGTNLCLAAVHDDHESSSVIGFYYWSRMCTKFGYAHKVSVDRRTKIVDYVPANNVFAKVPQVDLRAMITSGKATLIHADVGVAIHKPTIYRQVMPERMLRLHRMWGCGGGGSLARDANCFLCSKDTAACGSEMRTCPICMLTSHVACAERLAECCISGKSTVPALLPESTPVSWRLCKICCVQLKFEYR